MNILWYTIDLLSSYATTIIRVIIGSITLGLYINPVVTYNNTKTSVVDFTIDIICMIGLITSLVMYLWRLIITTFQMTNFFTTTDKYIYFKFKNLEYFITKDGEVTYGYFSLLFGIIFAPLKIQILADIIALFAYFFSR